MYRRFLFLVAVCLLLSSVGSADVGYVGNNAMVASSLAVSTDSGYRRAGSAMGQSMAMVGHSRQGYSYSSVSAESTAVVGAGGQMAYSHSSAVAVAQQTCVVGPRRRIIFWRPWLLRRHLFWRLCAPVCRPSPPPCLPSPPVCW